MKHQYSPNLLRAVWVSGVRQIRIFVRYPSWLIAMCIWPILFPFTHVFASRALAGPDTVALESFRQFAGTTDYTAFIAIGTGFWLWFNAMLWGLGGSLRSEQMRGTLESNWLAPVPKVFLLLGSFWADAVQGLVAMFISYIAVYYIYGLRILGSMWHLLVVIIASIPSVYGIGMIFASLVLVAKETNSLIYFVRGIMTVFCGITYPIAVLPGWMKVIAQVLPLTHSIQAVRAIMAGLGLAAVKTELSFLLLSGAILLAIGAICFSLVERHLLKTGTVGQY